SLPTPLRRSPPYPPASGIARPDRPPAGCAGSWHRCITKTCRSYPHIFAKSSHPLRTCPQVYTGIVDRNKTPLCATIGHSPHDIQRYRKVELDINLFISNVPSI